MTKKLACLALALGVLAAGFAPSQAYQSGTVQRGLWERISPTTNPSNKISVHRYSAALRQWARAKITRAEMIAAFELSGADLTDTDAIAAAYTAKATADAKQDFLAQVEECLILVESGDYPKTKAKAVLEF